MKKEHQSILRELVQNHKFPLKEANLTKEETTRINDFIKAKYPMSEVEKYMRRFIKERNAKEKVRAKAHTPSQQQTTKKRQTKCTRNAK